MKKKHLIFFFLLATLLCPSMTFGQGIMAPESPQALSLRLSPYSPKPNSIVTISAESLTYDLDRAIVAWMVNGTEYQSGAGLKKITLQTLGNGEAMVIMANVTTLDGFRISRSVTIRPSNVDLLWEAISYTPPFYRGKTLISHEAIVKVVALSELVSSSGQKLNPAGLVYKWSKDGKVLGNQSGLGKNILIVQMPQLTESTLISVEVSSADNLTSAKSSLNLRSINPEVRLYENHPLFGVRFERALSGESRLSGNEIVITGYPYYFSSRGLVSPDLKYTWRINRSMTNLSKNSITLKAPEGETGKSQLTFKVDNMKEIMQSAQSAVELMFGGDSRGANPFF